MAKCVAYPFFLVLAATAMLATPSPIQLDLSREAVPQKQLVRRADGSVSVSLVQKPVAQELYWFDITVGTPPQVVLPSHT